MWQQEFKATTKSKLQHTTRSEGHIVVPVDSPSIQESLIRPINASLLFNPVEHTCYPLKPECQIDKMLNSSCSSNLDDNRNLARNELLDNQH